MNRSTFTNPRFSLLTVMCMFLLCSILMPIVLYFPFTCFVPNLGGKQGFPLPYYTWRDFGPPFSFFLWWNLIIDVIFLSSVAIWLGYLFERTVIPKLGQQEKQSDSKPIISIDNLLGISACLFSLGGIIIAGLIYNRWLFAPTILILLSSQVFAIIFGFFSFKNKLGKTAVASGVLILGIPLLLNVVSPGIFGSVFPETNNDFWEKYEKGVNSQPEPVRSLFKVTLPDSSDPHMMRYKNAILEVRKSFSPLLIKQLISLIDQEHVLDYEAGDLLENIYSNNILVDGVDGEGYTIPDSQLKTAMETLINSTTHSKKHNSIQKCFFIFVKAIKMKKAELYIPFLNESMKYSKNPDGSQTYSYGGGEKWDKRIDEIIPIFQKYCREQLENIEIETERKDFPNSASASQEI